MANRISHASNYICSARHLHGRRHRWRVSLSGDFMTDSRNGFSAESCDLKPCPFCGSGDLTLTVNRSNWKIVECDGCGMQGACIDLEGDQYLDRWNNRTFTDAQPSGLRECLQSIADADDSEPREPDDADWRFRFLEAQRAARCALAAHPGLSAEITTDELLGVLNAARRALKNRDQSEFEAKVLAGLQVAIARLEAQPQTVLGWLATKTNYELSYSGWDNEHPTWEVHSVNGGRNDREWTLLATGSTPEEALRKAMSLSLSRPKPSTGC